MLKGKRNTLFARKFFSQITVDHNNFVVVKLNLLQFDDFYPSKLFLIYHSLVELLYMGNYWHITLLSSGILLYQIQILRAISIYWLRYVIYNWRLFHSPLIHLTSIQWRVISKKIVQIYPEGKMSQHLASLQPGDVIEVKG